MKSTVLSGVVAGLLAVVAGVGFVRSVSAQASACRVGAEQTPTEIERRRAAIQLVRAIHNAEASFFPPNNRYGTLQELSGLPDLSTGKFDTRVVVSGKQYSILVRDTADDCGYTLFSDQQGLIYIGSPMR